MENENKNKPHRHKSYFISPNGEQSANNSAQAGENNKKRHNHHRPKHRHHSGEKPETQASEVINTSAQTVEVLASAEQANSGNNNSGNKSKRHKNKHKKHSDTIKDTAEAKNDVSIETAEENSEKELEFPKFDRLEKPAAKKLESFSSSPEFQKYKDYREYTYEELYGDKETVVKNQNEGSAEEPAAEVSDGTVEVVGIRFKSSGKTYYFDPNGTTPRIGSHAIVETARGLEYGEVVMSNTQISENEVVPPLRPVVRVATQADVLHNEEIKKLEETAFRVCNEKIIAHGLDMKLIDAQYTFDNTKLLFYFTSSGRVDFRELVKDLASVFRTRIELRQIGIRDEAKMVGGLGICGRPLCCSIFLTDFGQVSIKMAKEQNLSLNSAKISGICGRLMCCLRYEHETYEYEIKRTPPVDTLVRTVDGVGTVTEISPLQGTIKVRLAATPEVPPKSYKRDEVTILKKKD
jgi:cell fate regulator YaaT (PSP1 superfamily)